LLEVPLDGLADFDETDSHRGEEQLVIDVGALKVTLDSVNRRDGLLEV
jgi:hypothetical protein